MIQKKKESARLTTSRRRRVAGVPKVYEPDTVQTKDKLSGYETGTSDPKWQSGKQVGHKV